MKWTTEEIILSLELYNSELTYDDIAIKLNRTFRSVELKLNKLGLRNKNKFHKKYTCKNCETEFIGFKKDDRKFCTLDCSLEYNNNLKKTQKYCLFCGKEVRSKYCNNRCKSEYDQKITFDKIEQHIFKPISYEAESSWVKNI